jgi:hypothetical protein
MAATPTHDLVIKNGEYLDRMSGETKARWLTMGTLFEHDDGGLSIKLDCLPVGIPEWNGWVSVFQKKPRDESGSAGGYAGQGPGGGERRPPERRPEPRESASRQGRGYPPPLPPAATDCDDDIPF